ncbi:protein SODIUM POTASSIUM ROOT DEFECTIVE 3-like isoform X2 [Humulus lupulus]|uniref:protein SODIUM POTASSIUM ROOT DEFECTIVE 3-like isoform X2 n=1 Tax=Humulus lupulus TaxID=3486 RepID=UPI002B4148BC|nr:protein SODIUM POTASSIUM ROOT DEFECTIVE 3-like isoform X2 [Humulus lupulus]
MKGLGIDIFCASQASTAICLSMDEASSSSSTIQLGGKAIDRHNPIISDTRRGGGGRVLPSVPCSYHPPINPKSYHQLQKTKKSSSNASKTKSTANEQAKKSSHSSKQNDHQKRKSDVARKSSAKAADLVTPPGSTRYLLSDAAFLDGLTNYDPVLALVPLGNKKTQLTTVKQEEESSSTTKDSSSNHSKPASSDQVVVLRVSLHCRGCEGKVRKHLSRMEGVTSFNIDFAAKKVTVVGDVTPVSVLASISKVKNAQFWTASSVSSVTPANPNPNPTLKQQH